MKIKSAEIRGALKLKRVRYLKQVIQENKYPRKKIDIGIRKYK